MIGLSTRIATVATCISLSGCAVFMTPEERSENRYNAAMSRSVVNLCYGVLVGGSVYPEELRAVKERGVDCLSPEIVSLVNAKQQADAIKQSAPSAPAYPVRAPVYPDYTPPKQTTCRFIGNTMTCY